VPFGFLKRNKDDAAAAKPKAPATRPGGPSTAFEGLTEEWRLVGRMHVKGRLTDALNKRESITISEVTWAPIDGSGQLEPAPGLKAIDPYDLILVVAGESDLPPLTEAEKSAHKVHKIDYDVALEAPPFRVLGTVHLYPGSDPDRLLDRATEMFVPVTEAVAYLGDAMVSDPEVGVVLVNRFYLRGVEQIDKRTGLKPQKLPGAPLGGTSWQDRSR
jgi:hypothetical protein